MSYALQCRQCRFWPLGDGGGRRRAIASGLFETWSLPPMDTIGGGSQNGHLLNPVDGGPALDVTMTAGYDAGLLSLNEDVDGAEEHQTRRERKPKERKSSIEEFTISNTKPPRRDERRAGGRGKRGTDKNFNLKSDQDRPRKDEDFRDQAGPVRRDGPPAPRFRDQSFDRYRNGDFDRGPPPGEPAGTSIPPGGTIRNGPPGESSRSVGSEPAGRGEEESRRVAKKSKGEGRRRPSPDPDPPTRHTHTDRRKAELDQGRGQFCHHRTNQLYNQLFTRADWGGWVGVCRF